MGSPSNSLRNFFLQVLTMVAAAGAGIFGAEFAKERPTVQISQGILAGVFKVSRNGTTYSQFLGIPYGKSARFEDSVLADGWKGVRDASKFGEVCIQINLFEFGKIEGSETCLFLNVYTPKVSNASYLSVMVFIHGGGYQFGSSAMGGGKYFMDQNVILVTINYRLGPFGFSDTGIGANFGLKDQVLALKWVQLNIQQFGGHSNSVTIFGESAGGFSVSYLILSPLAKGLFHRAISQSGTSNSPYGTGHDSRREFKKLGILMDCPTSNQDYLIQCLKRIDPTVLLKPLKTLFTAPELFTLDDPQFYPTVDRNSKGGNVFLPETPLNLMRSGNFSKVPWIAGVNTLEGVFAAGAEALMNQSRTSWGWTDALALVYDQHDCKGIEKIRKFYVGNSTQSQSSFVDGIFHLFSDRYYVYPTKVSAILHAKHAPAFLYYFSYKSESSSFSGDLLTSPDENGNKRPAHMDELQYLFEPSDENILAYPEISPGSKNAPFSNYFVNLWASFAKNGQVALETLSSRVTPTASPWTRVSKETSLGDDVQWFEISNVSAMVSESKIFGSRLKFWNHLIGED